MLPLPCSGALESSDVYRAGWTRRCRNRLAELKPLASRLSLEAVAKDMLDELGDFDPELAAEMEFESGALDDLPTISLWLQRSCFQSTG